MTAAYSEAIRFLYDLQVFGAKPGLETTFKLAVLAGNPQEKLRFIHVAGTNGKGSTCAMLESIYRAAGLRVGLFTSPHLVAFGERIQVNRQLISEADVVRLVGEMKEFCRDRQDACPTFFEFVTVMALKYFAEQKCDLVIWETGLGGRLDATNIVTPLASVITNIQFDHQQWLGDTLERIATEKAGIIKPGVPVVTAVDDPAAFRILFHTAQERNAPFSLLTRAQGEVGPMEGLTLPLAGEHQRVNAGLAWYTVKVLRAQIPVDDATIRAGLSQVHWPGRLQLVERGGGHRLLLDGAHNIGSAQALRAEIQQEFGGRVPALILGILRDKDWQPMCETLSPLADKIFLVPVSSKRSASPEELVATCKAANPGAEIVVVNALSEAIEHTKAESLVILTGSLYLVGEAMELLGLSPTGATGERDLNEWGIGVKSGNEQHAQGVHN